MVDWGEISQEEVDEMYKLLEKFEANMDLNPEDFLVEDL